MDSMKQTERDVMKAKRNRRVLMHGSNAVISSVLLLGIFVIVALIVARHPLRLDLTARGTYTLGDQSLKVLASVKQPVKILAFFSSTAPEQLKAKDLLETYRYRNNAVTYEFIDPDRRPDVAKKYGIRSYGTLVVEGYGKTQTVQNADEEDLTNAIARLGRSEQKKVYFLTGHGEHALDATDKEGYSSLQAALKKNDYQVAPLNLLEPSGAQAAGPVATGKPGEAPAPAADRAVPKVPEDAAAVVVAGPRKPLFPQEVEALRHYVRSGGKALVMLDPEHDGGLRDFLKSEGIELKDDIIIDQTSGVYAGNYFMPMVTDYGTHKITEKFRITTFFPEARSVTPTHEPVPGVQTEVLVSTSDNSWAETDFKMLDQGQAQYEEEKDTKGPVPILVLATIDKEGAKPEKTPPEAEGEGKDSPAGKGLLLVVGDSDFVANGQFGLMGNGDLCLNIMNYLGEEENLITVEHRASEGEPLLLTRMQVNTLVVVLVMVPCIAILAGIAVYRIRRRQR